MTTAETVAPVVVIGSAHHPLCLVARHPDPATWETPGFPWCTCPAEFRESFSCRAPEGEDPMTGTEISRDLNGFYPWEVPQPGEPQCAADGVRNGPDGPGGTEHYWTCTAPGAVVVNGELLCADHAEERAPAKAKED